MDREHKFYNLHKFTINLNLNLLEIATLAIDTKAFYFVP